MIQHTEQMGLYLGFSPWGMQWLAYSITITFLWLKSYLEMCRNLRPNSFLLIFCVLIERIAHTYQLAAALFSCHSFPWLLYLPWWSQHSTWTAWHGALVIIVFSSSWCCSLVRAWWFGEGKDLSLYSPRCYC